MEILGFIYLRRELMNELPASMHRNVKASLIIWPFRAVSKIFLSVHDWFDLWLCPQCVTLSVSKSRLTAKPLMLHHSVDTQKERNESSPLWARGHQGDRQYWLEPQRLPKRKEKTAEHKDAVAWQAIKPSDDTLPTVLGTVNKCVCEMLWRMFSIQETKCQCVVLWQQAQLAKWHNMPASNKVLHCKVSLFNLFLCMLYLSTATYIVLLQFGGTCASSCFTHTLLKVSGQPAYESFLPSHMPHGVKFLLSNRRGAGLKRQYMT